MSKSKARIGRIVPTQTSGLLQGMIAQAVSHGATTRREGHSLPLTQLSGESRVGKYAVDMRDAPIPQRRYATDLCSIDYVHGEMRVIFAQQGLVNGKLDSALVIRMNSEATINFADSLAEMDGGTEGIMASVRVKEEELSEIKSEPEQIANMVANLCFTAIAGRETCLDFYHASAFAIRKAEAGVTMEVEPVVRVDMRTSLFISFMSKVIAIRNQIKSQEEELSS